MKFSIHHFILIAFLFPFSTSAQDSILTDNNGDGKVSLLAFGDSLTYGVGDGTAPGQSVDEIPFTDGTLGYPKRLGSLLSVPVSNVGNPGEVLGDQGILRLPTVVGGSASDFVLIMEGINDARQFISTSDYDYEGTLQKAINVTQVFGKTPLLLTLPNPCCEHEFLAGFAENYSNIIRKLAAANDLPFADISRAWKSSCVNKIACELYNVPEGLHPNSKGYTVIVQTVAATLLGVDVFLSGGAEQLSSALGIPPQSIVVKSDEAVVSNS